jgi:hypothetical protein
MADPVAALATQLKNIEARTGRRLSPLQALPAGSGLAQVGEQHNGLMQSLGLGCGEAHTELLRDAAGVDAMLMGWIRTAYDASA